MSHQRKKSSSRRGKDFWGPPIWTSIHILAFCFDPKNESEFIEFLWLMTKLLPCDYCKKNLETKLQTYPPERYTKSQSQTFYYSYVIHDLANQHISRYHPETPKTSPSFDSVLELYQKNMSRGSKFWGHSIWAMIHILAVTLQPENSSHYERFIELLVVLLPNAQSRQNLQSVIEHHPIAPYLRSNHDAFFYSYMLHNLVNKRLNKGVPPPYEKVKSFYFSALGEECNDCQV